MRKLTNKLIANRRSKWALPAMITVALITVGSTLSLASAFTTDATSTNASTSSLIATGKNLFLTGCSSCHGINAEGSKVAPSLIGVGGAAVDFQVGTGRMPMADYSQQAMRKTPLYNPDQVAALAAYIQSLAPGPDVVTDGSLSWEKDGNAANGGTLFRTNCAMCHNFAAQGGALTQGKWAPTLMAEKPGQIYEAMITGPQSMPKFSDQTLTPQEKLDIIAWIKSVQAQKQIGGTSLGRVGPVTEGLLAWVVGIGAVIGIAVWLTSKSR
jgi:ubiquinol-cytochrome c reductase cytochrome c subunit